ncbi:MAG: cation transporter [Clostridia bacterium]|nr:cation transporter [Clostridia bacterium]
MNEKKSGKNTLLWSVIMSAPGPLVMGLGLIVGKSSTQIADFVRRTAELLGIVMAYVVYLITNKDENFNPEKKARLEKISNLFVGAMMCLGGAIMLMLAFLSDNSDKGNVIPGLAISLLGVVANTIFWRKYTRLNKQSGNAIIAVQARLYGAKSLVDGCVTLALLSVAIFPKTLFSYYLDIIGSAIVAVYLIFCGGKTIYERIEK